MERGEITADAQPGHGIVASDRPTAGHHQVIESPTRRLSERCDDPMESSTVCFVVTSAL